MSHITDEQILHLWDAHVGEPTAKIPLIDADKTRFARAVLALQSSASAEPVVQALRHAQTWIASAPHGDNCFVSDHYEGDPGNRCNCGKDSVENAIFEALTPFDDEASPPPVTAAREQEAGCAACVTCGQPWPEASATGAEPVQWHVWIDESHFCQRCGCGANSKQAPNPCVATPTTSTTGKVDADEAFEELYKVSSRDPSNREDLGFWRAGWVAGQRALPRPVDASRVRDEAWQPIETAPSDVVVLLFTPELHFTNPKRIEARVYHDARAGSRHAWATHWMPLPAPPVGTPKSAEGEGA